MAAAAPDWCRSALRILAKAAVRVSIAMPSLRLSHPEDGAFPANQIPYQPQSKAPGLAQVSSLFNLQSEQPFAPLALNG